MKAPLMITPLIGSQPDRSPVQLVKTEASYRKPIENGGSEDQFALPTRDKSDISSNHERSMMSGSGVYNSRRIKKRIIQPNAHNSAFKHFPSDFFNCQESDSKIHNQTREIKNVIFKLGAHYFPGSTPEQAGQLNSGIFRQMSSSFECG